MMANVSSLIHAKWYLGTSKSVHTHLHTANTGAGIPFNDTSNFRFQIAEQGEAILGDNLLAFQAANEPDLYGPYVLSPRTVRLWRH